MATYTADGRGNSGKDESGQIWEVEATDALLSQSAVDIAAAWYKHRSEIQTVDGLTDEPRLKQFLSNKLGVPEENVTTLLVTARKKMIYNGQHYATQGVPGR